jgi:uncharacterized protein (DUF1810 family)
VNDPFNLQRFETQQADIFGHALAEIRAGQKRTHWMWFIFPQLRGLGHSQAAQYYGIASIEEARAYLYHPRLGPNLRTIVEALMPWRVDRTAGQIFGSVDAMKLRSCLTLFEAASDEPIFGQALDAFFGGDRDPRTLALLNGRE